MRGLAAAVLLLGVAGCHEQEGRLRVTNTGRGSVEVIVEYRIVIEAEDRDYRVEEWRTDRRTVREGEQKKLIYPTEEMDVTIVRMADGLVLFQAYFTPWDFEEDHGTIGIAVDP